MTTHAAPTTQLRAYDVVLIVLASFVLMAVTWGGLFALFGPLNGWMGVGVGAVGYVFFRWMLHMVSLSNETAAR
jgi:hypothetical protein